MSRYLHSISPAFPAALLLFGMVFGFAVTYFARIPWSVAMTVGVYGTALVWVLVLLWRNRRGVLPIVAMDVLFLSFVAVVMASLVFHGGLQTDSEPATRYVPFMVIAPYLCGRLMRQADIDLLARITVYAGGAMSFLLLFYLLDMPDRGGARWPFFGQDHGALLVAALLAPVLIAFCARPPAEDGVETVPAQRATHLAWVGFVAAVLVGVAARGWLLAALAGMLALVVGAAKTRRQFIHYLTELAVVIVVVLISLWALPRPTSQFYGGLLIRPAPVSPPVASPVAAPGDVAGDVPGDVPGIDVDAGHKGPVLGVRSCKPLEVATSSVAIRWVLYKEAHAMFRQAPWSGVGAASFGKHSCTGPGGFPHSTVMQAVAELGLPGGCLLFGMYGMAGVVLLRRRGGSALHQRDSSGGLVWAWFVAFVVGDQIYGNYFMSTGTYLMLGIAAGAQIHRKQWSRVHG